MLGVEAAMGVANDNPVGGDSGRLVDIRPFLMLSLKF